MKNKFSIRVIIIYSLLCFCQINLAKEATPINSENLNNETNNSTIQDIEGNTYNIVRIGNQEWSVENWKCTKYNDGTPITLIGDNKQEWLNNTQGACCYYNNNIENKEIYGILYNWYAVNTGMLAPNGWRVPTLEDWETLRDYLIANGYNYDDKIKGNKLAKSMAQNDKKQWGTTEISIAAYTPHNILNIGNKYDHKINSSGFSALPGGCRPYNFQEIGSAGFWWSSTSNNGIYTPNAAYYAALSSIQKDFIIIKNAENKGYGMSVRLVRDTTIK